MEKLRLYLNYIAIVFILLSLVSLVIWPYKKIIILILGLVGAAALVTYVFLNLPALKKGFRRKSFIYSSNSIVIVALVLTILFVINSFFARLHHRFDFTEKKLHSL